MYAISMRNGEILEECNKDLRYRIRGGQVEKPRIPESETGTGTDTVGSVRTVNKMFMFS